MLRICVCLSFALLLAGCDKNWRGLMIEKRVYRDGYYVHVPWKRYTPKNEYPKPQPYPVDHSRTAQVDTTQKTAGGVATDSTRTQQTVAGTGSPGGTGNGPGSPPPPPLNQAGDGRPQTGAGNPNAPPPPPNPPADNPAPPISYAPPPPLQPEPVTDPPLYRQSIPVTDTAVAVTDSISSPTDTVADDGGFKFPEGEFSLVAEAGFYNPAPGRTIEVNPFSYNVGAGFRYTIHPWSRHQLSLEGSAFVSHVFINQEQHKHAPLFTEPHNSERIMQWKMRFMLLDHVYITRSESVKFDAVEFGLFGDLGFFSTHIAVDNHWNDSKAAFTRSKTRLAGLKYLRAAQFGCTLRVANEKWSIFGNYRLTSLLKPNAQGEDLPKIVVGFTRQFGWE